jgi:hypothetical protein
MIALLSLFLHTLVSPFKTQARLEAEILVLRHQLNVLRRQASQLVGSTPDRDYSISRPTAISAPSIRKS